MVISLTDVVLSCWLARDMGMSGDIAQPRGASLNGREPSKVGRTNLEMEVLGAAFLNALWVPAAAAAPSCPIMVHCLLKLAAHSPNRPYRSD
jgi:hypothetical protein